MSPRTPPEEVADATTSNWLEPSSALTSPPSMRCNKLGSWRLKDLAAKFASLAVQHGFEADAQPLIAARVQGARQEHDKAACFAQ